MESPRSGTLAASCRPSPSAHPGVETPTPLWRRCPGQRRSPRREGPQHSDGLGGPPGNPTPRPAGALPASRRTEGHRGDAGGPEPALTIPAAFGGGNGRAAVPPGPGAKAEAEGGTRTRRRERARSRSAWYMVQQEPG